MYNSGNIRHGRRGVEQGLLKSQDLPIFADFGIDRGKGRTEEPGTMEERVGISAVLSRVFCWLWQRLAISLYSLREWRRRLSNPVHNSTFHNRQAVLLHGNGARTIHQQILPPNMVRVTCVSR